MDELSNLVVKDKKPIIEPNKVDNIDYNSKSFLKGLNKVNEYSRKEQEMSNPNHEKKYLSFNI